MLNLLLLSHEAGAIGMTAAALLEALRQLTTDRRAEVLAKWNRSVSFGDQIIDRWEKARSLGFGEGSSVYDSSLIIGEVVVGERTWIGPGTVLDGSGTLRIGDFCSISAGVQVYTHDSVKWSLSGGRLEIEREPVTIGSYSYIGPNTIVTKGVTIGEHCLVGANSIVNTPLPDCSIAFGSTCRVVGRVEIGANGEVNLHYFEKDSEGRRF